MSRKAKNNLKPSQYDADFKAALQVLGRAAKRAEEIARRSRTPLVLWREGRITTVKPAAQRRNVR